MRGHTKESNMEFATSTSEMLEISIAQAKAKVDDVDALKRLIANPDFKRIIMENYFKSYAVTLVMLKADPSQESDKEQENIDKGIAAIGQLEQFFKGIFIQGDMARKSIADDEESLMEERNSVIEG